MKSRRRGIAIVTLVAGLLAGLFAAGPALAVFSGDMSPRPPSSDKDYAAGIEAFEFGEWQKVVDSMAQVVARRPQHDNAWSRLGYAHRKLGRYEASLFAYGRALQLNPHHRNAMEYLGEAYLDLGRLIDAQTMLERLGAECRRVALTFSDGAFANGCTEYVALRTAIDRYIAGEGAKEPQRW